MKTAERVAAADRAAITAFRGALSLPAARLLSLVFGDSRCNRCGSMANINYRKRAAHRRRVQAALQEILNDPAVMPNADCLDLMVSVSRVEFGRTVREIYIDVLGEWRRSPDQWGENPHDRYMRQAQAQGKETYADLTEVFMFASLTEVVARELQKRLGLLYTPVIRRLCDLGGKWV